MTEPDEKESMKKMIFGMDETIERIKTAISDFESGRRINIAIMALPYAGKSELLKEIVKMHPHNVTKVTFSSIVNNEEEIPLVKDDNKIMLFDNCHYLYMRKIGGFDVLEKFLEMVVSTDDKLCITTWNIHSWNYLNRAMDIGRYFPIQITIPQMGHGDMKKFLLSEYEEDEIKFINDTKIEEEKIFRIIKKPIKEKFSHSNINLYTLKINYIALRTMFFNKKPDETAESIIFKEILRLSSGNPGVATEIWDKWLEYPIIRTSSIDTIDTNIDLGSTGRFVLYLILSMGHIKKEEMKNILNWSCNIDDMLINKILFEMQNQDIIMKNAEYYSVKPERLYVVVRYLQNIRLVW
ncbi:MAG: hypothetical protein QCH31_07885 [Methanolobus sp.]|nr:hypothetical protein [Methanolobus sp.]